MGAPQEPPAVHRDGGWGGGWERYHADVLLLCACGQDTCLAPTCSSLGLKTTPFLQHQRDWSCEMERYRGAMQPPGQDPSYQQLQNEKYRLSCLKHCPLLRQPVGYLCHTPPLWRGILYVRSLPCYFWLLKQQRTNILFSCAQLVQEKSVSDGSAAHFPHLVLTWSCWFLAVIDGWYQGPVTRNQMGFSSWAARYHTNFMSF